MLPKAGRKSARDIVICLDAHVGTDSDELPQRPPPLHAWQTLLVDG
jgi:hypothetical protein